MKKTLKNFIKVALSPVGKVLYVYGGGWNYKDTAASIQTKSIGLSIFWIEFFNHQNSYYDYNNYNTSKLGYNKYFYCGLDCSGYIGWVVYNILNDKNDNEGYVFKSTTLAYKLHQLGLGSFKKEKVFSVGDIVSIKGHVWLSLGTLDDGSVLIIHSSPTLSKKKKPGGGVQLSAIGKDKNCEAYKLAKYYMEKYYKEWSKRYDVVLFDREKYTDFNEGNTGVFSFDSLEDPDNYKSLNPSEILKALYAE